MIVHKGSKWILYSSDGSKMLGEHDTEEEAKKQEAAVQAHKHDQPPPSEMPCNPDAQKMDSVTRYDAGGLEKPKIASNGWMRADAYLTRTGVFEYRNMDGSSRKELRLPEEVFRADSVATFELVPLTNEHPREGSLDATNTRQYQVGTVVAPKQDGERLRSQILVTDAQAISEIKAGKTQLSCGYTCDLEFSPGDYKGERYDAIQRNIRGNHVALVRQGRAGPEIGLRADSAYQLDTGSGAGVVSAPQPSPGRKTVKLNLDGLTFEVDEVAAQAIDKTLNAARAELEKTKARADAAEAAVTKLQAELEAAPAKISEKLSARAKLAATAQTVLGVEVKVDEMTDAQLKAAVIEKSLSLKCDGKSEEYVQALFDLAVSKPQATSPAPKEIVVKTDDDDSVETRRAAFMKASREAYKTKK